MWRSRFSSTNLDNILVNTSAPAGALFDLDRRIDRGQGHRLISILWWRANGRYTKWVSNRGRQTKHDKQKSLEITKNVGTYLPTLKWILTRAGQMTWLDVLFQINQALDYLGCIGKQRDIVIGFTRFFKLDTVFVLLWENSWHPVIPIHMWANATFTSWSREWQDERLRYLHILYSRVPRTPVVFCIRVIFVFFVNKSSQSLFIQTSKTHPEAEKGCQLFFQKSVWERSKKSASANIFF